MQQITLDGRRIARGRKSYPDITRRAERNVGIQVYSSTSSLPYTQTYRNRGMSIFEHGEFLT